MKKSLKFLSLMMALIIALSSAVIGLAAQSPTVSFDANGKLKIMHISDCHLADKNVDASTRLIALACDREKPDVVVITGDNVTRVDDADVTKEYISRLMNIFESREIPVAVTFGNHDSENSVMSREELLDYYNTFSCSLAVNDVQELSGCGTYNVPVISSDGSSVKFNLWIFDSNDYDEEGRYACVKADQVEWYKAKSDELKADNGGEKLNSLAFQHIIVQEVYDVLKKVDKKKPFSFKRIYSDDEYYMFDPDSVNYGTLNETPCSGYENFGQFDAMVEKGDVLAIFSGHDHTNAFGVRNQGIDIMNSLSTRYNRDAFSSQYGYRIIEIDEADTSVYKTRVVHWYDMFTACDVEALRKSGDKLDWKVSLNILFLGFFEKTYLNAYRSLTELFTGRQITY